MSTTLASAISRSNIEPTLQENVLVINRKSYLSRGNGKECVVSSTMESSIATDAEGTNSNAELFWRTKFDEMCELNKIAERDILDLQQKQVQKEAAMRSYIQSLENKLTQANNSDQHDPELKTLKNKLNIYEVMTSMTVTINSEQSATCVIKNVPKRQLTRFDINVDNGEVHFAPTGNVEILPEFLQANLSMEEVDAPLLLGNILQCMFEDNNSP